MKWTIEDYTKANGGCMRIFCDGERAADVFPFADGVDPEKVKARAHMMIATLNGAEDEDDSITCEGCGKAINPGDKYTTTLDGCYLCETDAPSFQDCVDHWADRDPSEFDEGEAEAAEGCRQALAAHIAAGGSPEDKPLIVLS